MRAFTLSLAGLTCLFALMLVATSPAKSQPGTLALGQTSAGDVEEVGYRYRRYRYGYGYHPYYQSYYRPYGYYHRPYYGYGYGYPYYRPYYYGWRPGISLWFGF